MSEAKRDHVFKKEEVATYERKRYRGLDQRFIDWREKCLITKIINSFLEPQLVILDIPCGYGRFTEVLKKKKSYLISSDLSPSMVARARQRSSLSGHASLVSNVREGIPLKSGTVDCVFCFRFFHHLHHLEERRQVLSELVRVSRKLIIVSYYQTNRLHQWQRIVRKRLTGGKTKIKMITPQDFKNMAKELKCNIIKVFPVLRGIHSQHIALLEKGNENSV